MLPRARNTAASSSLFAILVLILFTSLICLPASAQTLPDSGWWWNPAASGTGYFIERQGTAIFMVSYLYASNGQATWLLAQGNMSGSTFSAPLQQGCCGQTINGAYQAPTSQPSPGNVSITFSDAQHGSMTTPGGTFPIQRFSFTGTSTIQPPQAGAPLSGWWWNPDESGRGFGIEFQGNRMFMGAFMYNTDSTPICYLDDQTMQTPTSATGTWMQGCCGQTLTGPYQPAQSVTGPGSLTIQFTSSITATLTLPNGRQIPLQRFQFGPTPALPTAVTTYHNDLARTGANLNETILMPQNVNSTKFGKLASYTVDGQVYAQPLVVPNLTIAGATHNVVFVATEHDSVYAFDADGKITTPFWTRSFINPPSVIPAQSSDTEGISPEIGVTGTPVIDLNSKTMYLVAMTNESGNNVFRLHALDLATGAEKFGGPVVLNPSVPGTGFGNVGGTVTLDPGSYQRPGLLLYGGNVYVAWGHDPHGFIASYNATTLAQTAVFCTSPNGKGAAIWMGGGAPAVDPGGSIYVMTGVDADSTTSGYSDAFVRFNTGLQVLDFFQPSNNAFLTANDADLGSGAPVILPDNHAGTPQVLVGAGKDGRIFLLDRTHLGGFNSSSDQVVQEFQSGTQQFDNFFDTPAYWNNLLYYHAENDVLRAFTFQQNTGLIWPNAAATSTTTFGIHGATASVSAANLQSGIVWELQVDQAPSGGPAILHAYQATDVSKELYNSTQAGTRDTAGPAVKFTVPTVVNGHVYVGTANQLDIYGLL